MYVFLHGFILTISERKSLDLVLPEYPFCANRNPLKSLNHNALVHGNIE